MTLKDAVSWLRGKRWPFWAGVIVVWAGVWGFAELAEEVQERETASVDERIFLAIAGHDVPDTVKEIGRDLTALGGFALITLVVLFVAGVLALQRKFAAVALVLVATLGGLGLSTVLKHSFDRPRPDLVERASYVATSSFPSGHSMLAATVYLSLGLLAGRFTRDVKLKVFFLAFAVLLTGLVGVSRVFVGVHWPTDVVAGWAGGATWATLCYLVARELQRREMVEDPGQTTDDLGETKPRNPIRG